MPKKWKAWAEFSFIVLWLGVMLCHSKAAATGPSWWYDPTVTFGGTSAIITDPAARLENDYAIVNQGQVKNIAVAAVNTLNADLAVIGGAGLTLNGLATALTTVTGSTSNYATINLGQLKNLSKPYFDLLLGIDYDGPPLFSGTIYPWIGIGLTANDYSLANIGQVKQLFSFDPNYSVDGNPLPDWWRNYFFGTLAVNPNALLPASGGAITPLQAWQQRNNPLLLPAFSPQGGVLLTGTIVTLTATGATSIYYTVDGSIPSSAKTLYSSPIPVSATQTIKAVAYYGKAASSVSEASYTMFSGAKQLAVGARFMIALKSDGTVWAWGDNFYNTLGLGASGTSVPVSPFPIQVPGVTNATAVAAAYNYAAALRADGTVWVWGTPNFAATGNNGSLGPFVSPTQVQGVTNASAIAAGENFMLALSATGSVFSWGYDGYGQLGFTSSSGTGVAIVPLPAGVNITNITAGNYHSLALSSTGSIYSWGANFYGQLGNGSAIDYGSHPQPTMVQTSGSISFAGVTMISAGGDQSCAVAGTNNSAYAWGYNQDGEVGQGSTNPPYYANPTAISSLANVTLISAGYRDSIAVIGGTAVYIWGLNAYRSSTTPSAILQIKSALAVATNYSQSAIMQSDGTVWTFGNGTLGIGTIAGANIAPTRVEGINLLACASLSVSFPTGNIVPSTCSEIIIDPVITTNWNQVAEVDFYAGDILIGTATSAPFTYVWRNANPGLYEITARTVTASGFAATSFPTFVKVMRSHYDSIAAGSTSNTILRSDGSVWSVGDNSNAQLGDGTTRERHLPVYTHAFNNMIAVSQGHTHGVSLKSDGTVWNWGAVGTSDTVRQPTVVAQLSCIDAISSGSGYSLALDGSGNVWGWGANTNGQLGTIGTYSGSGVVIPGISSVAAIAAGNNTSYALDYSGILWAWGGNAYGQVGNNSTADTNVPASILSKITAIAGGDGFALAVDQAGSVWSWGNNASGQLGRSGMSQVPAKIAGLSGITAVSAASGFALALDGSGNVWAWGANGHGQLGNTSYPSGNSTPVPVLNLNNVVEIACSGSGAMALTANGIVWAWGANSNGQLGTGDISDRTTPVQMGGLQGTVATSAGAAHTLALHSDGTVWGWGANYCGQLGNNSTADSVTPVQASGITNAVAIASGSGFSLALESDGSVWAWGDNTNGQLGDGTAISKTVPTKIAGVSAVVVIAAGQDFSVALAGTGQSVKTWGDGVYGQLGNGAGVSSSTPVTVNLSYERGNICEVAAGGCHAMALTTSGFIWTWGRNNYGQLGQTGSNALTPSVINSLGQIIGIAAGGFHSLALTSTGSVMAWGDGANGQLGNSPATTSATPLLVLGLPVIASIRASQYSSIGIGFDGSIWIWGDNAYGEIGNNSTSNNSIPFHLTGYGGSAIDASSGDQANYITLLRNDGTGWAWGLNGNGQLGDGTTMTRLTPVASGNIGINPTAAPAFTLLQPIGAVMLQ